MMKDRQLTWARANGIPAHALEERDGAPSWVLKPEHQRLNLYQASWWEYIAGREHRWARALNSSQCFAVNLFAPLKETSGIAWRALNVLLPERHLRADARISVEFEYLEPDASGWLAPEAIAALSDDSIVSMAAVQRDITRQPRRRERDYLLPYTTLKGQEH